MDSIDFTRAARAMRALQCRWASADSGILYEHHLCATVRSYARQANQ